MYFLQVTTFQSFQQASPIEIGGFLFLFAITTLILTICYLLAFKNENTERIIKLLKKFNVRASAGGPEVSLETHAPEPLLGTKHALSAVSPESNKSSTSPGDEIAPVDTSDLVRIAYLGTEAELTECFKSLQKCETNPEELEQNEARYHQLSYERFGNLTSFASLREKSVEKPISIYTLAFIECLSSKERDSEIISLLSPILEDIAKSRYSYCLTYFVNALSREHSIEKAYDAVLNLLPIVQRNATKVSILHKIGELYAQSGTAQDLQIAAAAYELSLQFNEDNDTSRFKAAYAQAEANIPIIAYSNYRKIGKNSDQYDSAANNLGVLFDSLELPGQAKCYYRSASELGNTLSSANLAFALIRGGFLDEAAKILKVAAKSDSPHENVSSASNELNSKIQSERDKLSLLDSESHKAKVTYRKFCSGLFHKSDTPNISGIWVFGERALRMKKIAGSESSWASDPIKDEDYKFSLSFTQTSFSYEVNYKLKGDQSAFLGAIPLTISGIGYYDRENDQLITLNFTSKGQYVSEIIERQRAEEEPLQIESS